MSERDKDDLADALSRLAAGEHHEPEHDPNASQHGHDSIEPPHAPPAQPSRPAQAKPPTQRPAPTGQPSVGQPAKPAAKPAQSAQQSARPTQAPQFGGRPAAPAQPARPAAPVQPARPSAPPPQATRPAVPAKPVAPRTAAPTAASASSAAARPAQPARPAAPPAPAADAAVPPAPRTRPAAPSSRPEVPDSIPASEPASDNASIETRVEHTEPVSPAEALESQEIYEDDEVIAPAPDASVFAPKPAAPPKAKRTPYTQTLEFKRTVIPVMLTSGTIMLIVSIVIFVSGRDSMFATIPAWLAIVLLLFGLILLGLAAMNMMQVSKELEKAKGA